MTFKVWDKVRCIEKLHLYLTEWKIYEVMQTVTWHIKITDDLGRKTSHVLSRFELVQEDKLPHQLLGLPKYFVVKKDKSDPLWDLFLIWINKEFNVWWSWSFLFYWYNWWDWDNWTYWGNNIEHFKNNPTLIALAERDRIVNKKTSQTKELSKPIRSCEHNWSIYKEDTIDWVSIEDMKATRYNINSKLLTHRDLFTKKR